MARSSPLRRGPKLAAIKLVADERDALERIVRASTAAQRDVLRANIVLLAADGHANSTIAEMLGVEENTVGKWRRRFATNRVAGLRDEPRSGRPSKFTARQKTRVLKKATQRPRDHGVPFSHWDSVSLSRLAVSNDPLPGTVLTREYKGREVRVRVLEKGFEYEGQPYRSLSAVAKAITGSHWNGRAFFGLKKGRA